MFALSLGFVFLILAALYESWSLPFSVLLSVPVAVVGAFLGLFGRGLALDVYGQIGLVMLIGLAAKNAILIVEFAKDAFERGEPLVEAALQGARLRLRPILMTSFAFILGCVPLWTAQGAGAAGRQILGTTVISGMLAATGLAIFIIPVLFVVVERLAGAERKRAAAAGAGREPHGGRRMSRPRRSPSPWPSAPSRPSRGCAVGPNYKRPSVPVPDAFYGEQRLAEARALADVPWWDVFDDPVLKGLVEEALRNGFDARAGRGPRRGGARPLRHRPVGVLPVGLLRGGMAARAGRSARSTLRGPRRRGGSPTSASPGSWTSGDASGG